MFKIKGREVIKVDFTWTLEALYAFMQENWDTEKYGSFEMGKPIPTSIESYVYLPATQHCLVIVYPRKGKVILSVADNPEGAKRLFESAFPTHDRLGRIYKSSLSIDRAKEMKGPAAEICEIYADHMRELLADHIL